MVASVDVVRDVLLVVRLHVGRLHVVVVRAVGVVVARLAGGAGQAAGTGVAGNALRRKRSSLKD